jgi:hypothetical protein
MPEGKMILLHGFSREELGAVMGAVRGAMADPGDIAFAVTTPSNIGWKVGDLVAEVRGEHEYLKKNPPGSPGWSAEGPPGGPPGKEG